jgi:hypothetical protein
MYHQIMQHDNFFLFYYLQDEQRTITYKPTYLFETNDS